MCQIFCAPWTGGEIKKTGSTLSLYFTRSGLDLINPIITMWGYRLNKLITFDKVGARDTHTKRQATRHGCLPSLLGNGDRGIEIVYAVREKIFCTGPTRAAKAEQKSLVPALKAQQTNQEKTPLICPLWVPIHLSFNSQQGPPLSSLSGWSISLAGFFSTFASLHSFDPGQIHAFWETTRPGGTISKIFAIFDLVIV